MKKLKEIRESKKLSIEKLSKISGVAMGTISILENGKTEGTVKIIRKLAEALDCTVNDLIESA